MTSHYNLKLKEKNNFKKGLDYFSSINLQLQKVVDTSDNNYLIITLEHIYMKDF